MLLGREQSVIGHDPVKVRAFAEAHLRAYGPDDIEILMASCSPAGGIWAGLAPPDQAVLSRTPDEIRASYVPLLGAVNVRTPDIFAMVCTDWYCFFECVTPVLDKASGQVIQSQAISLFGNDDLGLAVDMAWPFGVDPGPSRPKRPLGGAVRSELTDLAGQQRRIAGWIAGDAREAAHGLAEDCLLFLPCFDPRDERLAMMVKGRAAYEDYLRSLWAIYAIRAMTPANVLVGDQYVFGDFVIEAENRRDGGTQTMRYALAEVVKLDGGIGGMLGFATRL